MHDNTKHHPPIEPQHVCGAQNQTCRSEGGNPCACLPRTDQHKHLANKTTCPRQTDRGQHHKHEKHGKARHHRGDTAIGADLTGMKPVIDNADTEEQGCRDQTVADHLEHRTGNTLFGHGKNTDGDKSHMGNR